VLQGAVQGKEFLVKMDARTGLVINKYYLFAGRHRIKVSDNTLKVNNKVIFTCNVIFILKNIFNRGVISQNIIDGQPVTGFPSSRKSLSKHP
jgi:hypothetical protein